ncbi:MAG: helix-turn-helix transcriptional regulator [Sneathiella sp.]|nr:helix-turn-helix transcriptional regulator [Sneathiella sp.]
MGITALKTSGSEFGNSLRKWRQIKGFSQLDLALAAESSARHVSFLETGRAKPSREMVLRLSTAMDLPLRDRNRLLNDAGFRAAYAERPLQGEGLDQVRRALDYMLQQQEPYPAMVMNRCFDISMINHAGAKMMQALGFQLGGEAGPPNMLRLALHPDGFRTVVKDWERTARHMLHRAYRQVNGQDAADPLQKILDEVLAYPGVPKDFAFEDPSHDALPVLPIELELNGLTLSWITTVASFGTPQDVTAQEIMVESMFPANAETEAIVKAMSNT